MEAICWLIAIVAFLAIEAATLGLTTIWFAAGAVVGFIAALLSAPLWLQFVLFVTVSGLALVITRPMAVRFMNRGTVKTNYESMVGRVGEVVEEIDNLRASGCVRVGGQEWTARSAVGEEIVPVGSRVIVKEIDGVKLIVAPEKKEEIK